MKKQIILIFSILIFITNTSLAVERTATLSDGTQVLLRDNGTWEEIKGSGMPIDCSWKITSFGDMILDYYYSYVNSDYESEPDGKYRITIYSNYINGNFRINEIESIPYIKSKSTFAPEWDGHWSTRDLKESEKKILQLRDGFSECKIKTIVYKGE